MIHIFVDLVKVLRAEVDYQVLIHPNLYLEPVFYILIYKFSHVDDIVN